MLRLDALTLQDMEQIRQWRNADLAGLRTPYPLTVEMQRAFYQDVICNRSAPHRYWALVENPAHDLHSPNRNLLGMGGLTHMQRENSLAEISLLIDPCARGRGDGIAAVVLLLAEGFGNMGLETIVGEIYRSNAGAKAFWEKALAGLTAEWTVLPRRKRWHGVLHDADYFTVSIGGWAAAGL